MNDNEQIFLSLVAIGWFSIDADGRIWRHIDLSGSKVGAPSIPKWKKTPTRAETSEHRPGGHMKVQFTFGRKRMWAQAHRLVWMTHNKALISNGMDINHIDGNPQNNHPSNLEVVTRMENVHHSMGVLRNRPPGAKLTVEQVLAVRHLFDNKTMTQKEIGAMFGITSHAVQKIGYRQTWRFIPEESTG